MVPLAELHLRLRRGEIADFIDLPRLKPPERSGSSDLLVLQIHVRISGVLSRGPGEPPRPELHERVVQVLSNGRAQLVRGNHVRIDA